MGPAPQELNWVKQRFECSVLRLFADLHKAIEEDVRVANEILPTSPRNRPFEVVPNATGDGFAVRREQTIRPTVTFRLESEPERIVINSGAAKKWNFSVGLSNEGRCLLREDGKEYELWQVRRMALEVLLFGQSR
jgi:hypothetical protein